VLYHVAKTPLCTLAPADEDTQEYFGKFALGDIVRVELKRARNYLFFRRWWSLIVLAFDMWCERGLQTREYRGVPVLPSKDRFRKDVTILAGYYEPTYAYDGSLRLEARSISFEAMEEDEFEKLYSATIDAILHKILPQCHLTGGALREAVESVVRYA
jgi:hypothetical protein